MEKHASPYRHDKLPPRSTRLRELGRRALAGMFAYLAFGASSLTAAPVPHEEILPRYEVAVIGDSIAAGYGVGIPKGDCQRGDASYATLLGDMIGAKRIVNVACTGARIQDVIASQIDVINEHTDIVFLTVGANQDGFSIGHSVAVCQEFGCGEGTDYYETTKSMLKNPRFVADYKALLTDIRDRAPNALIVDTVYPNLLENVIVQPIARQIIGAGSVQFSTMATDIINSHIEEAISQQHDPRIVYATPGDIGGNFVTHGPAALHPNLAGNEQIASDVRRQITPLLIK